jgi:hypothetical protein
VKIGARVRVTAPIIKEMQMPKQTPAEPAPSAAKRRPSARTAPPRKKAAPGAAGPDPTADRDDAIRRLAYGLYEARGCTDGHALDDWLHAEAMFSAERERAGTA